MDEFRKLLTFASSVLINCKRTSRQLYDEWMVKIVKYQESLEGIAAAHLQGGFFEGWPHPPTPATHLRLLEGSDHILLAIDDERREAVVGFITAISDGVLSAYIPLLEVLPAYRGRGIGRELTSRMIERLGGLYMVDLICQPELRSFYEKVGMCGAFGMSIRHFDRQFGERLRT